jgi:glycosyltransferase involved in cell wall biosynthesis
MAGFFHNPAQPRFSVVMPVFNGERYMREAIESVLRQSYPAFELIVVDDGSTDRTAQIVEQFSRQFPILYARQDNQGPAAARNRGAALARGDWLAWLDADDVWLEQKLLTHRDHIMAGPDAVFLWSDWIYVDDRGEPIRRRPDNAPFASAVFGRPIFPIPSSVSVLKDVFTRTRGFDPRLRYAEDVECFARIARDFPVQFIARPLVRYRTHPTQLHMNLFMAAEQWPAVHRALAHLWRGDAEKLRALAEHSARRYTRVGRDFLLAGEYRRARHFFRRSFKEKPFHWPNLRRWLLSYLPPLREYYRRGKKTSLRMDAGQASPSERIAP